MTSAKDGGAAFPFSPPCDQYGALPPGFPFPELGMTLRDYFAAHAPDMPEYWTAPKEMLLPLPQPKGRGPEYAAEWEARNNALKHNALMHEVTWRWAYADAMIKARGNPT
jgi:hypothetical protein